MIEGAWSNIGGLNVRELKDSSQGVLPPTEYREVEYKLDNALNRIRKSLETILPRVEKDVETIADVLRENAEVNCVNRQFNFISDMLNDMYTVVTTQPYGPKYHYSAVAQVAIDMCNKWNVQFNVPTSEAVSWWTQQLNIQLAREERSEAIEQKQEAIVQAVAQTEVQQVLQTAIEQTNQLIDNAPTVSVVEAAQTIKQELQEAAAVVSEQANSNNNNNMKSVKITVSNPATSTPQRSQNTIQIIPGMAPPRNMREYMEQLAMKPSLRLNK